jgi:hypothetical protein
MQRASRGVIIACAGSVKCSRKTYPFRNDERINDDLRQTLPGTQPTFAANFILHPSSLILLKKGAIANYERA